MSKKREIVKALIELSRTPEEADKAIVENYGFQSVREKVAFLKGMYDIEIVGHENDEPDETTYLCMLHSVII